MPIINSDKKAVNEFWEAAACGENLYLKSQNKDDYHRQIKQRNENLISWSTSSGLDAHGGAIAFAKVDYSYIFSQSWAVYAD